jgi:hypothetical protein
MEKGSRSKSTLINDIQAGTGYCTHYPGDANKNDLTR